MDGPAGPLGPVRHRTLGALLDDLLPPDAPTPGAGEAGGADYVATLLGALDHEPPRIWAGGPFSGRHGGDDGFSAFFELGPWEALAWRRRLDGWLATYTAGLDGLGDDYPDLSPGDRAARRDAADDTFLELAFEHGCESLYGDPVYGGNRDGAAWAAIDFRGDSQPAGYTADEVTHPGGHRR